MHILYLYYVTKFLDCSGNREKLCSAMSQFLMYKFSCNISILCFTNYRK